jgi:DNA-binding response OmpR family regulator
MAFDHDKLQTIVSNLISNAIKFTPEGGQITVTLRALPDSVDPVQVEVGVRDTGMGIPADKIDRIFERFYQVDHPDVFTRAGSGIGLAMVQELVKFIRGSIQVDSISGQGTTFRVTLPYVPPLESLQKHLVEPPQAATEQLPSVAVADKPSGNNTLPLLLLVEDNPDVLYYIAQCMRNSYRLITAVNGADGIQKALELVPDIVVSDVMMPEKDGFELCETLKNTEATSHIPIVLLTARADFASRIAGLRRGADDYLAKPFEPDELLVRLDNLVRTRRLLQQRFTAMLSAPESVEDPVFELENVFLQKIREVVETHLSDADFDMPQLERALGMSHSQVFRKVKALTGHSPSVLIRTIRLHKSRELLKDRSRTIAEVAYEVGFSSPAYFSTMFLEAFGKTPSDFRQM